MGCGSSVSAGIQDKGPPDRPADPPDDKTSDCGQDVAQELAFIKQVQLFKRLPEEELPLIVKACSSVTYPPGETIIKQGTIGYQFFIIKAGNTKVDIDGKTVTQLKPGAYFGEMALLRDEPRNATIVSQSTTTCLTLSRDAFFKTGLNEKLEFGNRGAVGGGHHSDAEIQPPATKSEKDILIITKALQSNENLNTMIELDDNKIKKIIEVMWREDVQKGTEIIKGGDMKADYFYVVKSGGFCYTRIDDDEAASVEQHIHRSTSNNTGILEVGKSFGELALLYLAPRAATITATSDSVVFVMARQQFKSILLDDHKFQAKQYLKYLEHVEISEKESLVDVLDVSETESLVEALTDFVFSKDEIIFEQGEEGTLFYILVEGKVSIIVDGQQVRELSHEDAKPFFGEKALLNHETRAATIKVISDSATCLVVDKMTFDMLLGPLKDLQHRRNSGVVVKKLRPGMTNINLSRFGNIKKKDLRKLGLLGCGGFGCVELVEHLPAKQYYALKALSKGYLMKCGMQKSVISEKEVQMMCDSPFIVKLFETFNGQESLYLLLELALGGELWATYNKKGLWGSKECAKFYVAGTVFAFEHLHAMKIAFRDLKPENLLLNEHGNVKLTDMGLAKVVVGKTFTTCGTPDYFAPELIASRGHGLAVDWWTLGILNFELLGGHPPFESATPMQTYQKVNKGIGKVVFPKACCGVVESLIKGNLRHNPAERLPMKRGGTENVKKHDWYKDFSWESMKNGTMPVPYKPSVGSPKDMSNFSARKEDMPPQVHYKDPKTDWDKDFATSG